MRIGILACGFGFCRASIADLIEEQNRIDMSIARVSVNDEIAQAPQFYINKNIQTVAPHKKQRRSKFKRR